MSRIIKLDGVDHWVSHVSPDGSSEGIDYDIVYVRCRVRGLRFKRPVVVLDNKHYAPVRVGGTPTCLACFTSPFGA